MKQREKARIGTTSAGMSATPWPNAYSRLGGNGIGHAIGHASRTAAYGRACYSWAVKRGAVDANPFQSLPAPSVASRDRVLTDDELRAIWSATEGQGVFNGIVRVLLLTSQRREEVAARAWSEISADGSTWTLPASRAKNGVAHLLLLSKQAQTVIEKLPRTRSVRTPGGAQEVENQYVFQSLAGPFNGFSKSKAALDEVSGVKDLRLHDLRRTMATGLQSLGVRLEGHRGGSQSHQRHARRNHRNLPKA